MSATHSICGVGRPTLELLGTVHRLPGPGERAELQQFSIQGSGSVATALVALLEWGHRCRLAGRVSDDPMGKLIRAGFDFEGFDASGLVTTPGHVSPFGFVALTEAERMERTEIATAGTLPSLSPEDLDLALLEGCSALLVDGSEAEAQIAAAEAARERGVLVVFDASREAAHLDDLITRSDVLIASERFAAEMAPHPELIESLADLRSRGPRLAIVTMGVDGSMGLDAGGEPVRQPIFDAVVPRERGGAGHLFFAGVTHGLLQGWPLARLLRFATAAAGLSCREIGARGGIPTLAEVLETADIAT